MNSAYNENAHKTLADSLNVVMDKNFKYIVNENGTRLLHTFTNTICGIISTPEWDIVFCTDDNELSEIYKYNNVNEPIIICHGNFGFRSTNSITGVYTYNSTGDLIIVWTDNINPVRCINVTNTGFTAPSISISDIDLLNLNPNFKQPIYTLAELSNGGNIEKGTYYISIAYYLGDYDLLNWCYPSNPINMINPIDTTFSFMGRSAGFTNGELTSATTVEFNFTDRLQSTTSKYVSKKMKIDISNLDTRYKKFRAVIIYKTDTATKVYNLGDFNIASSTESVYFDGTYLYELAIDEVTIPFVHINKALKVATQDNNLLLGNITPIDQLDYQNFANNIKVAYTTKSINGEYDTANSFFFKGCVPDEVYNLYIGLVRKNGTIDNMYHIPGRAVKQLTHIYSIPINNDAQHPIYENSTIGELLEATTNNDLITYITNYGYIEYKDSKIFTVINTAGAIADTGDTIALPYIKNDLLLGANIPATATFTIKYIEQNNPSFNIPGGTPVKLKIIIDRSSVPSELYKAVNNDIKTYHEITIGNPPTIKSMILPPFFYPTVMGANAFYENVKKGIESLNAGYIISFTNDNGKGVFTITAPTSYGTYGNNLIISITAENAMFDNILGIPLPSTTPFYGTNLDVIAEGIFQNGSATPGTHTGKQLDLKVGETIIASYVIPLGATNDSVIKGLCQIVNDTTNYYAEYILNGDKHTLKLYADPSLGGAVLRAITKDNYKVVLSHIDMTAYLSDAVNFTNSTLIDPANYGLLDVIWHDLGYWENETELYPNNSDFAVYTVDQYGLPIAIPASNIMNEKVRHHKMPDLYKIYNTQNPEVLNKAIGLYIRDINIPADILPEIQGYVIGYATKDTNNISVLGYSAITPDSMYGLSGYGKNYIRFNDINLVQSKIQIDNCYLKVVARASTNITDKECITPNQNVYDINRVTCTLPSVYKVDTIQYAPYDNSATVPSNKGREKTLFLKPSRIYNQSSITKDSNGEIVDPGTNDSITYKYLDFGNICSKNSDLYAPFTSQKIALVDNIKPVNKNVYSYGCFGLYGFDAFISKRCELQYRGDQSLDIEKVDDNSVYKRANGDNDYNSASVINVYRFASYNIVNYLAREMDIENLYKLEYSRRNWLNILVEGLQYKANFNINPSEDDGITYNYKYNYVNNLKVIPIYDTYSKFVDKLPNRIYRSNKQSKESLSLGWRNVSALSYYEIGKNKGSIANLVSFDNVLIIHTKYSIFLAKLKDKINYNQDEVYLGQADIFDREPLELHTSNDANLGLQSHIGTGINNLGYCFYNPYHKKIYVYSNQGLLELNTTDCNEYIDLKFNTTESSNSFYDNIVIFGYDNANKRLIITNKSSSTPVTLSYYPQLQSYLSKHSYIPTYMYENKNGINLISPDGNSIYRLNEGDYGSYFGQTNDSYVDVLLNTPMSMKQLQSLSFVSSDNNAQLIDKILIYTQNQVSKEYIMLEFNTVTDWDKIRYVDGRWFYNNIRDFSSNDIIQNIIDDFELNMNTINEDKLWYELSMFQNNYFIVRIICNNNHGIIFNDVDYEYVKI
jgi:hypothetical protein